MKFAFLAFSEVNPDNVSVYAQTHKRSAPAQPCAMFQKRSFLVQVAARAEETVREKGYEQRSESEFGRHIEGEMD
jgi:hypothetical protein